VAASRLFETELHINPGDAISLEHLLVIYHGPPTTTSDTTNGKIEKANE